MTRILFTTMPMAGHVRPLLPLAQRLVRDGHEVTWYTGRKYESAVVGAGATFVPYAVDLDWDDAALEPGTDDSGKPEKPGLRRLGKAIMAIFVAPIPRYMADLDGVFDGFTPEVVVAEQGFVAGPMLAEKRGIGRVFVSVSPLSLSSVDAAPFGMGLPPSGSALGRLRNRGLNALMQHVIFARAQRLAVRLRAELGMPPLSGYFLDWSTAIADRYLVASVPELEYPRGDLPGNVEFVGAMLPTGLDEWTEPAWWSDVARARNAGTPVVLVTQGTIATDPRNLILPTIEGLASQDLLLVAAAVGCDPAAVMLPEQRPANLRLAGFIPFTRLLPMVDVMVTNGGFGGVQTSLASGVPLVIAGTTEDKLEVGARVAWAGVGVALRTDTPSAQQVADGVRQVLGDPSYRAKAAELMASYARHDGTAEAAAIVLATARTSNG